MDEELLGIVQAAHRETDRPLRRFRMDKGLWDLVARRWTARWFPQRPQQDLPLGDVEPVQVGFLQIMQRGVAQLDLGMTDLNGLELIDGEGWRDVLRNAHDADEVGAAIRRDEGQQIAKHLRMEVDNVEADVERWPLARPNGEGLDGIVGMGAQDGARPLRIFEEQLRRINELHVQLREQAIRDDLTGVYNRRHFVEVADNELERARRQGASLSLVMLDIDHFKNVNDSHGHAAGDAALKAVGAMLGATTRVDDLACRLGGEEFAVLLSGVSHDLALQRAEKWRALLADADIAAAGAVLRLTASFGVATLEGRGGTIDELMKVADTRLYRAKSLGRNRVVGERAG